MNQVNLNFTKLLLAERNGNIEMQKKSLGYFYRLAASIAYTHGWFHPDGPEEWRGVADDALLEQLKKYECWSSFSILRHARANGFARVYLALKNRIIDEVRRLVRRYRLVCRCKEVQSEHFGRDLRGTAVDLELRHEDTLKLIDTTQAELKVEDPIFGEILHQTPLLWADSENWESHPNFVHAELKRRLAAAWKVTPQHAGNCLRRFREAVPQDVRLQRIVEELRDCSAGDRYNLPRHELSDPEMEGVQQ